MNHFSNFTSSIFLCQLFLHKIPSRDRQEKTSILFSNLYCTNKSDFCSSTICIRKLHTRAEGHEGLSSVMDRTRTFAVNRYSNFYTMLRNAFLRYCISSKIYSVIFDKTQQLRLVSNTNEMV